MGNHEEKLSISEIAFKNSNKIFDEQEPGSIGTST